MLSLSAIICSSVTFIMALLHILLTLGFPIGEYVLGGKNKVIPVNKRWQNFSPYIFNNSNFLYNTIRYYKI